MTVCAGDIESFEFATPIGIGLVESAMNLTRIILNKKPDAIVFIGSAGSYGKYKPFDIVESTVAVNIENSFLTGGSYTPIKSNVSRETIDIVNSSNYITTDEKLSKGYRDMNIELENMEFYSVVRIAQEFKIPVKGIFIVTNYCNKSAHKDFITNHEKAKTVLERYL
ncbi:MAG TPA: purine-nucleoside phosphorylase [Campylobacterales bacterium]|nr:purine-nucleoside phosphorylase [Campylobacterales bacterium]